jgi:hypothetical protein
MSAYKIQMPGINQKKEYNICLFCISMQAHVASPEITTFWTAMTEEGHLQWKLEGKVAAYMYLCAWLFV